MPLSRLDSSEPHLQKTGKSATTDVCQSGKCPKWRTNRSLLKAQCLDGIDRACANMARRFTLERRSDAPPDDNAVAQWITLQPELLRQRLVDDDHRQPVVVLFPIRAASQDQNLQAEGSGPATSGIGVV